MNKIMREKFLKQKMEDQKNEVCKNFNITCCNNIVAILSNIL